MKVYIDGTFFDERDAKVSVFDHGLLYGDGVFEGIRAYNGRVFRLKEHIDRLFCSAKAILLMKPDRIAINSAESFHVLGSKPSATATTLPDGAKSCLAACL